MLLKPTRIFLPLLYPMKSLFLFITRLFCTFLVLGFVLWLMFWRGGGDALPVQELPPLRIVCHGGDKVVRCPTQCVVGDDGQADCRCQDFFYQRGDEPLAFSHSLCR